MPARHTLFALALALLASCRVPVHAPSVLKDPPAEATRGMALPAAGLYDNSTSSPLFSMIDGTTQTIDIAVYEMTDANVRSALRRALARGVRVRVIKEPNPVDDRCNIFGPTPENARTDCDDEKKLRSEILSSGGAFVPFRKSELCADPKKSCFMHGKMVISDGRALLVSTGNFNPTNLCDLPLKPSRCNRDFTVIIREPKTINFFGQIFERDLSQKSYDLAALIQTYGVDSKVTVSPLSLDPLLRFIHSAQKSLLIHHQYLKDPSLNSAIVEAASRGVRVQVTLASLCSFGPPSPGERRRATEIFSEFDQAGVSIRMVPSRFRIGGKPGYMHAKAMIADGQSAWVGSVNGSTASLTNNREFGVFFDHKEWISALSEVMTKDHLSQDTETWKESLDCAFDSF